MSENEKNVPKRRFKEFENAEAWEQRKLDEIATMKARIGWQGLTQKEFLDDGDYYLITGTDFENGQIDFTNCHYINKERYNQDVNIQVRNGDVLITKDGTIGKVAYIRDMDKPATLNAGVFVIKGKDKNICNLYLYHYLAAPFLLDYADKQATGGTIKHLNQNVLVNFPIPLPKVEEQQQIGGYFQQLDNLITIHQRKLEKMKSLKKAYLTELFPAEGKRKPKLRFAGFTDEWEQRKLEEIVEFLDEQRKPLESGTRESGEYPYYGASGIIDYVKDYLFDEELILLSEDGANIVDRNYRVCFLASGKYWVNNHAHVLKSKNNYCNGFICEALERLDYVQYNTGTAQPKLNQEVCRNIIIMVPNLEEQQRISSYLVSLDNLITLHQRKLEKLQNIKKAYLNEMFI